MVERPTDTARLDAASAEAGYDMIDCNVSGVERNVLCTSPPPE